ncbi:MAG: hypothetical protein ACFFED_17760, partial [Candidatus Thorarchaeota archaeon]
LDRYDEVLAEVPRVRAEFGYPPLVTPSSQIVGTQATLNVITGERYSIIPHEVKQYFRGYYGRPPAPVDEEVKKKAIGDEEPLSVRPADLLEPELPAAREALKDIPHHSRDLVSYALFPQYALDFLKRKAKKINRGTMTPELEVALIASILHVSNKSSGGPMSITMAGDSWSKSGREALHAARAGSWEKNPSAWSVSGRKHQMRPRTQGGP